MEGYKKILKNYKYELLLVVVTCIAFILRLRGIDSGRLWLDELFTFERIQGGISHTIALEKQSAFPPLYYILLHLWCRIFGYSEFALRFPSLIFSTVSVVFFSQFLKKISNEKVALWGATLLCFWPCSILFAQEAKMYAMLWCLSIPMFSYFYEALEGGSKKSWLGHIVYSSLVIYTMYIGFLFLIVQAIILISLYRKRMGAWLTSLVVILLSYSFWLPYAYSNMVSKKGILWIKDVPLIKYFKLIALKMFGGTPYYFIGMVIVIIIIMVAICSLFDKNVTRLNKKKTIFLLLWSVTPVIIYMLINYTFTPIFVYRYVLFIHIPIVALCAFGLERIQSLFGPKLFLSGFFLMLGFYVLTTVVPMWTDEVKIVHGQWEKLFKVVCVNNQKNIPVLFFANGIDNQRVELGRVVPGKPTYFLRHQLNYYSDVCPDRNWRYITYNDEQGLKSYLSELTHRDIIVIAGDSELKAPVSKVLAKQGFSQVRKARRISRAINVFWFGR